MVDDELGASEKERLLQLFPRAERSRMRGRPLWDNYLFYLGEVKILGEECVSVYPCGRNGENDEINCTLESIESGWRRPRKPVRTMTSFGGWVKKLLLLRGLNVGCVQDWLFSTSQSTEFWFRRRRRTPKRERDMRFKSARFETSRTELSKGFDVGLKKANKEL